MVFPKTPHARRELLQNAATVAAALALLVSIFSLWQSAEASSLYRDRLTLATSVPLPQLNATALVDRSCLDCWSADSTLQGLKKAATVDSQTIDVQAPQGQALVKKYDVLRAPTIIVTGEIGDARLSSPFAQGWARRGDAYVFEGQKPVYFNPQTNETIGRVRLTRVVEPSCSVCVDLAPLSDNLKQAGVVIGSEEEFDASSPQGAALIRQYNASFLPLLVLSKDASAYPSIVKAWSGAGTVEPDGVFVWRKALPPYFDLASNRTQGLVDITFLNDSACAQCYDVNVHQQVLANFGVAVRNVTRLDVTDVAGRALVEKYGILVAPTVLLTSDARLYDALNQVWSQVGTVESDGTYVFRNMTALGNVTVSVISG